MLYKQKKTRQILWTAAMSMLSFTMFFPILMMLSNSFKGIVEIATGTFHLIPGEIVWTNFKGVLNAGSWGIYFRNSMIITFVSVILSLILNSIAGYAFARLKFRGSRILFFLLLIGFMLPYQVTLMPTFLIMAKFPLMGGNDLFGQGGYGLINSYAGLIIPLVSGSYGVFFCKQFFETFPRALDDAAEIDGAGKFRTWFFIYLPNAKPLFASLGVTKSLSVWNDYMWPLVMTNSENMKTVQLALTMFRSEDSTQWHLLMAATTMVAVPMVILFLLAQKHFIRGIVSSGIK